MSARLAPPSSGVPAAAGAGGEVRFVALGVGFGRTGTKSLHEALKELLGAPCHHMHEVFQHGQRPLWDIGCDGKSFGTPDWDRILPGYAAGVDFPICLYWRELRARYPGLKLIVTTHPGGMDRWHASCLETIYEVSRQPSPFFRRVAISVLPGLAQATSWHRRLIWNNAALFGGQLPDRDHAVGVFERHLAQIRKEVPAEDILEYNVSQGWAPLAKFLGVKEPTTPFPRTNDAAQIKGMIAAIENTGKVICAGAAAVAAAAGWAAYKFVARRRE